MVLTGLNEQNVEGTLEVLGEVGISVEPRPNSAVPWDDADDLAAGAPCLGPKPTLLVASPVPLHETKVKEERLEVLRGKLGVAPLSLSYHALVALREELFVRDDVDERLTRDYLVLAAAVMSIVGDDPHALSKKVRTFLGVGAGL